MRFLMKVRIPIDAGNTALRNPEFGHKMQELLTAIKAEAACFTTIDGQRGAYIVINMDDTSKMPFIAEPFFLWLKADVEFLPVMLPQDLAKAGPDIAAIVKKYP